MWYEINMAAGHVSENAQYGKRKKKLKMNKTQNLIIMIFYLHNYEDLIVQKLDSAIEQVNHN